MNNKDFLRLAYKELHSDITGFAHKITPRNQLYLTVPWVRIPPAPPDLWPAIRDESSATFSFCRSAIPQDPLGIPFTHRCKLSITCGDFLPKSPTHTSASFTFPKKATVMWEMLDKGNRRGRNHQRPKTVLNGFGRRRMALSHLKSAISFC